MATHMITHHVVTNLCIYRRGWVYIVGEKQRNGRLRALRTAQFPTYGAALERFHQEQQARRA